MFFAKIWHNIKTLREDLNAVNREVSRLYIRLSTLEKELGIKFDFQPPPRYLRIGKEKSK